MPRLCSSQGQISYKISIGTLRPFTVTGKPCRAVLWSVMTGLNRTAVLLPLWPESPQTRPSGRPRRLIAHDYSAMFPLLKSDPIYPNLDQNQTSFSEKIRPKSDHKIQSDPLCKKFHIWTPLSLPSAHAMDECSIIKLRMGR